MKKDWITTVFRLTMLESVSEYGVNAILKRPKETMNKPQSIGKN